MNSSFNNEQHDNEHENNNQKNNQPLHKNKLSKEMSGGRKLSHSPHHFLPR